MATSNRQEENPHESSKGEVASQRALIFLILSVLSYVISLAMPALYTELDARDQWLTGFDCLYLGYLGLFLMLFSWLANFPLAVGWWALANKRWADARRFGLAANVLALQTLFYFPRQIGVGYDLWILSMLLLILGAIKGDPCWKGRKAVDLAHR